MKICSSCGSQMPDEAYTCSFCGTPLQASQDSQPPYVSQPSYVPQPYDPSYQQAGYYQPPYVQPVYADSSARSMATAALVLGIISLLTGGLPLGIVGCVLGVKARNAIPYGAPGRGMATAGLICSIFGIVIGAIFLLVCLCIFGVIILEEMVILGGLL